MLLLHELPPDVLALVLGAADTADMARLARTCTAARVVKADAVLVAALRFPGQLLPATGDALDKLRELEILEMRDAPVRHEPVRGNLPLPPPAASGCKYYDSCPWRLQTAAHNVLTGGTLRKSTPLSSEECFLEYRMVLENDGPPCPNTPRAGVSSFLWLRTVIEIVETYVPPHLRGHSLGDALVMAALEIELRPPSVARGTSKAGEWDGDEINQGLLRMRPTCTFVSGSFLRRHPSCAATVEFYSTTAGKAVTARRRVLKAWPITRLAERCLDEGLPFSRTKSALIESLMKHECRFPNVYTTA